MRLGVGLAEQAISDEALRLGTGVWAIVVARPIERAGASAPLQTDAGHVAEPAEPRPEIKAGMNAVVLPTVVGNATKRIVTDKDLDAAQWGLVANRRPRYWGLSYWAHNLRAEGPFRSSVWPVPPTILRPAPAWCLASASQDWPTRPESLGSEAEPALVAGGATEAVAGAAGGQSDWPLARPAVPNRMVQATTERNVRIDSLRGWNSGLGPGQRRFAVDLR